ncbi:MULTISPECIES: winged helix-turn-helix domain-containing protein [unclassified Variovorax]|uniref:ATP-binding protein n=1 Tax=unclassified Variovorax TaxID=663243 RepID=UPI00076DDC41|nr:MULTISPECIES: winged helix-turn-helix domain-containing protein [unclassified Variovorax]KWT87606.1 Signal transduction response regulator [Variovorax sp. WDL1]PNG51746.1 putative HTH-type transcriptional regulator [Variovorax sp. B2]PNG54094.1 putative HTH-type transcriptional regulator [Variovorax sp. B4]VTV11566.1 Transcriptional activator CadC [Variovorax sp. WDL1]
MPGTPAATPVPTPAEVRWYFGAFIVWEAQRRLERFGQTVRLGPRAFDLLLQLIKRAGEVMSKDELLAAVWTGVVVEDASVRVHMSTLRKALGQPDESDGCREWISNIPLRGYRFNGKVLREAAEVLAGRSPCAVAPAFTKLPLRLTELVGRKAEVETVLASLETRRLVTIVGTGGIGKTSLAIHAAECHQRQRGIQVAFVDLSPLISPDHVLSTLARSVGAPADLPDTVQAIQQCLASRDVLLLIDNCEHVVDSLALSIVSLLTALPGLRILATSREALRVAGEHVLRLSVLAVPGVDSLSLAEAMRWPSVQLLVERAKAAGAGGFGDAHAPLLAGISRQVDGIPLAIELVAARLGVQAPGDLARRLDDHMRLYASGNRAAIPRHRTLAAALDWSIALLSEMELRLLRALSVFRGRFDVDAALGVVAGDIDQEAAFDALISLVNKSLVFFDSNDATAPYRLLDTTRSYAAALLAQSDERAVLLRRHASLMLDVMKAATAELSDLSEQAWIDRHGYHLDDVRFALEVSLAQQPDAKLAASLATASAPLWFHLAQVVEYRKRLSAALALVDSQPVPDTETATWLNTALVSALLHTGGSMPELDAASERALAGALAAGIPVLELQARWGRCTHDMFRGEYSAALQQAEALMAAAETWSDPAALNLSHRVMAMASHFSGRFEASRQHSEASLRAGGGLGHTRANMVGVNAIVAAKAMLCRTLWIQGNTEGALEEAADAVARAKAAGKSVSLCAALYGACPVALWSGERALARTWVHMMMDEAQRKGLVGWYRYAQWFFQGLQLDTVDGGDGYIDSVAAQLSGYDMPRREMLATFCTRWVDNELIERVSRGESPWVAAEVWRAAGWHAEARGALGEAKALYRKAEDIARQQGAKGWALRAASGRPAGQG